MSTIPLWCRPGVEVECVMDFTKFRIVHDRGHRQFPELRKSYVTAEVEHWALYDAAVLYLEGFPRVGFDIMGFKPITKRTAEQDIAEHFADLLKVGAPERVGETA